MWGEGGGGGGGEIVTCTMYMYVLCIGAVGVKVVHNGICAATVKSILTIWGTHTHTHQV